MTIKDFTTDIEYGYCKCGCGQKTTLARQTDKNAGCIKGEPRLFIKGHNPKVYAKQSLSNRFWSKVIGSDNKDDCWLWQLKLDRDGYGAIRVGGRNGKMMKAHRIAYELTHGDVVGDLQVLHTCDTPCCVNPAHLFLGTHLENMQDKVRKGRQPKGEAAAQHKLTANEVESIRSRYALGDVSQAALARQFGVAPGTINGIVRGRYWKHTT